MFNVVAVSDFNMGAMENKGLNIFNDKYVLASPRDRDRRGLRRHRGDHRPRVFPQLVGQPVTCRDWFQLCLKEGLTVFRDQEFSSDMRSRPVHRIAEVRSLRARQFPEDAGPLRHPVRPRAYTEINNFYTATVLRQGRRDRPDAAHADRRTGVPGRHGPVLRRQMTAAPPRSRIFLAAFAAASGRDLSAFARWYERPGTPRLTVTPSYDPAASRYSLHLAQSLPDEAGQEAPPW